jgi:hypothetical protein
MAKSTFAKHGVVVLSVLVAATLLWAADKSWNKPYQNWDAKDIQGIMNDSPWVASTMIQISWHPIVAQKDVPPSQIIAGGVQTMPSTVGGGGEATNPALTQRSGEASDTQQKVAFYWASSKVMRVASARRGVLSGSVPQSDVEKYATTVNPEYAVAVAMQDMTPFVGKGPDDFKDGAFLEGKKSKVKVTPSRVEFQKSGERITDVVFFFPKTTSSGEPTITSDETDVVFTVKIAKQTLHADFKPKKMVDQFGPDL